MIYKVPLKVSAPETACERVIDLWQERHVKVVVMMPDQALEDVRVFYESLFPRLGSPSALAEDVTAGDRSSQRTGEIWMEIRYDPKYPDAYRHSANAQPLHTDGSYIPDFPNSSLLCCVTNACEGGETVFIESSDLVAVLGNEKPDLLDQLLDRVIPHERSGDRREEPVLTYREKNWFVNWNYYCVADDGDAGIRLLANEFQHFLLNSPGVKDSIQAMKLAPGEAVMWKDHEVLHGRNAFTASKTGERFIWKCAFDVGNFP